MPKICFEQLPRDHRWSPGAVLPALAIVVVGAIGADWPGFNPARERLQQRGFFLGEHDTTKLHALLLESKSLEVINLRNFPSTEAMAPALVEDGLPTISIVSDEHGLYSPERGIIPHAEEKGRRWERPATISYFENGALKYETPAGLRIHGGQSRKGELKSFQILFRRTYAGAPRATPGIFFGGESAAVERIVLSNTNKAKRFLNPLALEIAAQAGCLTSRSQPIRVVLNGEVVPCGYFLLEHQSREFLRHRFGHDDFEWVRQKSETEPIRSLRTFHKWVLRNPRAVTLESIAPVYDLNDLCAWIFVITYCGTLDEDQGSYFRDRSDPDGRWRSLAWDMDGSFSRRKAMEKESINLSRTNGLRSLIFNRLAKNDPRFREQYRHFAETALRERITPEFISALAAKYRAFAHTGIFKNDRDNVLPPLDETEQSLLVRREIYLSDLDRYFAKIVK